MGLDIRRCGTRMIHGSVTSRVTGCKPFDIQKWKPIMAYTQPHPRLSHASTEHASSTTSSTRFSLPSLPSIHTHPASTKAAVNRPNIYERNLNKSRTTEVSGAAFAFLFSEIVQYTQKRVSGINDLERQ